MSQIVFYYLRRTSVLSFYIGEVLTLYFMGTKLISYTVAYIMIKEFTAYVRKRDRAIILRIFSISLLEDGCNIRGLSVLLYCGSGNGYVK